MYKRSIFILGGIVTAVFLSAGFASATEIIADDSGDVWHWTWNANAGTYTWAHSVSSEPDIDINEISYSVEGQQVLLKIKVAGNIQGSNNLYYVTYNTTDAAYYMAYGNGSGMCMGFLENGTGLSYGNITVSGGTLIGKTNLLGAGTGITSDFYGYAYKYTHFGDTSGEWWGGTGHPKSNHHGMGWIRMTAGMAGAVAAVPLDLGYYWHWEPSYYL